MTNCLHACTLAEASCFSVVIADDNGNIKDFEEKPPKPSSNLASMGIYIFNWPILREALIASKDQPGCDFGMHVIPYVHTVRTPVMRMNSMATGRMLEHWDPTGRLTWN